MHTSQKGKQHRVMKDGAQQWRGTISECLEYLVNVYGDITVADLVKVHKVTIEVIGEKQDAVRL